nr:endonuclease MutS2 [Clostridiales bacterium]
MLKDRHALSLELDKVISMLEDRTTCAPARALAAETQPLSSFREASGALKQTLDAHMLLGSTGGPSFSGLEDISGSIARAQAGAVLTTRELLSAARDLRVIRGISEWRSAKANTQTVLDIYFNSLMPDRFLENAISTAIISEEEISDSASPELRDIRRKIAQKTSSIREKLDGMTRSEHYRKFLQESIITQRGGRYVVPVKAEHRGEIPGIVHDTSSSGATVFIEPMSVVEANNDIRELQAKERDEIERILEALSSQVAASGDNIKAGVECAAELDLIFARARLAFEMNAHAEIITDDGVIDLRGARHPLISKDTVVPVSIRLGSEFDTLVITGPNTGGKTVSIKTLGLLVLMARCGLMIPAEEGSRVSFFDNVYADIGDEQSIEQSLSTFSSHM